MTPRDLAHLHARAMTVPAPWSEKEFANLLATPGVFLSTFPPSSCQKYPGGAGAEPPPTATTQSAQNLAFALGRVILDEAELLTLAVDPKVRRTGLGRATLRAFETQAKTLGATRAFLEVAETNHPACALYKSENWRETGRRAEYYRTPTTRVSAILMSKTLKPA